MHIKRIFNLQLYVFLVLTFLVLKTNNTIGLGLGLEMCGLGLGLEGSGLGLGLGLEGRGLGLGLGSCGLVNITESDQ